MLYVIALKNEISGNPTKYVQDLYAKHYKTLMKQMKHK